MKWFLNTFCTEFLPDVVQLVLVLARFVLTHCYIACPEVSVNPFLQLIGTAMGTPFAVVYASIHLIFVETNAIKYKEFTCKIQETIHNGTFDNI